jgi:peptide/histidine transporter 3/4
MICLTLSVALPQLRPPQCATGTSTCTVTASKGELGFFWFSLYSISFALAGVKPCLVTFAADQFDEGFPVEREQKYSFFNWYYYAIEVGAILAQTVSVYIQENVGWGWGYGILTVAFFLSFAVTLVGTPFYRYQKLPNYSPFTCFFQVFVAAFRNQRLVLPNDYVSQLYEEKIDGASSADVHVDQRRNHLHVQHTADFL